MPKIKFQSTSGWTPDQGCKKGYKYNSQLHMAAILGKPNLIRALFESEEGVDQLNKKGDTPLHLAIVHNKPKAVKTLLDLGAKITSFDRKDRNPLHTAIMLGRYKIIKVMMQSVGYKNICNPLGSSPIHLAAFHNRISILETLINFGAEVNEPDNFGNTPLHIAVNFGSLKLIKLLLEYGANPNYCNHEEITPLFIVVSEGNENALKLFIQFKGDVNHKDPCLYTPLHLAAFGNKWVLIQTLILSGADVDAMDRDRNTPLHIAVNNNNLKAAETLIHLGAAIDSINSSVGTPLHLAISKGNMKLVELLLEGKKDTEFTYSYCHSLIESALVYCKPKFLEIVFQTEAFISRQVWNKRQFLHIASRYCQKCFIEEFEKLNCDSEKNKSAENISTNSSLMESDTQLIQRLLKYDVGLPDLLETVKKFIKCEILYLGEKSKMYQKWLSHERCEIYPSLIPYFEDCFKEVVCMRSKTIHERFTFYDFVTKHRNTKEFSKQPSLAQDYINHTMNMECTNSYPIYRNIIAIRANKVFLREELLKYDFYTRISSGKKIFLNCDSLSVLSEYLSNIDILNLTLAISHK